MKGLKEKFKKSIDLHEADNKRIMSQNEELISEINDLKREKKNLKDENRKREVVKENALKLQEERDFVEREFENMEKTLRQLKTEYEKKIKKKKDGVEAWFWSNLLIFGAQEGWVELCFRNRIEVRIIKL